MNIVVLFTEIFNTGGIQCINRHVCLALSQYAEQEGHDVTFLSLLDDPNNIDRRYLVGNARLRGFLGNKIAFVIAALQELRRRPNVVYVAHVNLASIALLMRLLNPSLRYGVALYGIEVWEKLPLLKRIALQQAAFVTSLSAYTSQQSIELQSLKAERVHLLPPAIDPFWITSTQEPTQLDLPPGKILLSVARLAASEKYKGVDCVIQALPKVIEKVPDVYYVVVGTGTDLDRLRSLVKRESLHERVLFVGEKVGAPLRAYYKNCDLFVMPSKGEGFGIVFLEAMFYKKPTIAGDHGGSRDVVDDGRTGILVKHGDIKGLSEAIISLLNDKQSALAMGQAGYQRLMSKYTYHYFAEKLVNLIKDSESHA